MERTVIIPALNPDEGLREIVERNWELENQIILVDDGSDKKYERLFWELGEKCIVLHHEENRGKGEAIKTALKYIKEELWECRVVGIMDADGQHLPDDMEKLLMKAAAEPMALIVGSRTIDRNVPWKSRMGNLITRRIFRMKTGVEVSDTQTGLRAFSTRLLDFMLDYVMLAGLILVLNNILLQIFMAVYIPLYPAKILTECTLFLISWLIQKKLIFSVRKSVGIKYPVLIKNAYERKNKRENTCLCIGSADCSASAGRNLRCELSDSAERHFGKANGSAGSRRPKRKPEGQSKRKPIGESEKTQWTSHNKGVSGYTRLA